MEVPKKQLIVQNHILELIRSGMRQGDLLPSIPELEKKLKLNKMTIGKAYAALESMDVLYKVPGKGTFVGIRAKAYKKAIPYFHRRPHEGGRKIVFLSPFRHDDPFMEDFTRGLESVFDFNRNILIKRHMEISKVREDQILRESAMEADGLILVSSYPPELQQVIRDLVHKNYPLVLLDNWPVGLQCHSVSADNADGVFLGMEHLYGLGHRNIVFVSHQERNSSTEARIAAYNRFMLKKALPPQVAIGVPAFFRLLSKQSPENRPTAIFTICDAHALNLCRALRKSGLRVPEDISVVGFDNDPIAAQDPEFQLTTIAQAKTQIGKKAIELLELLMNGECDPGIFMRYFVPCSLVVRKTTGRPDK